MRRRVVAAILVGTPTQTEGPFYPVVFPNDSDHDLLRNGALNYPEGQAVWLEGNVSHYHHPGDGARADRYIGSLLSVS